MDRERLKQLLREHEGLRLVAYRCPAGVLTIGYGHTGPDVTEGLRIDKGQAEALLEADASAAVSECRTNFPWFPNLSESQQISVASLVFNMGMPRLKGFGKMLAAIEAKDFVLAASELLNSRYAAQVGRRAVELAELLKQEDLLH